MLVIFGILLVILLLLVLTVKTRNRLDSDQINKKFSKDKNIHILLYFFEMFTFFIFFNWLADIKFLGYDEPSHLKRFIDFFTVYQIMVLVFLKMINSLKIDPFLVNRHVAELTLSAVQNDTYEVYKPGLKTRIEMLLNTSGVTVTNDSVEAAKILQQAITQYENKELTKAETITYLEGFISEMNFKIEMLTFHWLESFSLNLFK